MLSENLGNLLTSKDNKNSRFLYIFNKLFNFIIKNYNYKNKDGKF